LGYEELALALALAPDRALGRLCEWLGLDFSEAMLTPRSLSRIDQRPGFQQTP
jgi:hypothetical protein